MIMTVTAKGADNSHVIAQGKRAKHQEMVSCRIGRMQRICGLYWEGREVENVEEPPNFTDIKEL